MSKFIYFFLACMLISTPAYALDSGGDIIFGSLILMIPAFIMLVGGWGPIAIWIGALPAMGLIYGLLVLFNFTGENPRHETIFTAQRNYHISVREAARLERIRKSEACEGAYGMITSECNKAYVRCYKDNVCTGVFKQVYTERARELAANPNAFQLGGQLCQEEYTRDPVNLLYKCW